MNSVLAVKSGNTSPSRHGCVSAALINFFQMLRRQLCSIQPGRRREGFCLTGCPPTVAAQLSPPQCGSRGPTETKKMEKKKNQEPAGAEQTGFTELLSSQAPIPCTMLVAHSLSQGLWAVKYGFMCAHITFASRETFKSNYDQCYLHELLF